MEGENATRRRMLAASGLASVFGLSGCLRLSQSEATGTATTGDDDPTTVDASTTERSTTTTQEATETRAETETKTETESEETDAEETDAEQPTYPPGVSEDSVTGELVRAHREETTAKSRTVEVEHKRSLQRTTKFEGSGRMTVDWSRGPETLVEDDQVYQRQIISGQTLYAHSGQLRFEYQPAVLSGVELLEALVEAGDFAPVGRQTRDGETLFVLETDGIENASALEESLTISRYFAPSEWPIESLSCSALVTESGVIREMEASVQANGDDGTFVVNTSAVGSTSVPAVTWKETAKREAATFEASISADSSYVEVVHTGGQSIGTDEDIRFDIGVWRREYYSGDFEGSISEGTTFYLYKTGETTTYGSPKLGVSKDAKPSAETAGTWSSGVGVDLDAEELPLVDMRDVT